MACCTTAARISAGTALGALLLASGSVFQTAGAATLPPPVIPQVCGVQLKGGDEAPETLDQVRDLGVKWVRRGFIWEAVEKEKGVYDFSKYDVFVKNCRERGLSIIGCMAFSNKLYGHVKDEPARTAYANFAAALAAHYKDENILWEIWNEPNTMTFWGRHGKKGNSEPYAEEYTNLVRAAVPAMKKANPNGFVMAGSVSNMWTESYKWMDFCFAKGMLKLGFDGWSVHPYGVKAPEDYIEAYNHMWRQMENAGGPANHPLINSERGFPLGKAEGYAGGDASRAEEYQAWHLVRQYLVDRLLGVRITIWYEWAGKEGFALYRPGNPTPAFTACKVMLAQLDGCKLDRRLPTAEPRDFVLRFTHPSGMVKLVAWTAPPPMESPDKIVPHSVTVPLEGAAAGPLQAVRLLGEKETVEVKNGSVTLALTGAPQYITVRAGK